MSSDGAIDKPPGPTAPDPALPILGPRRSARVAQNVANAPQAPKPAAKEHKPREKPIPFQKKSTPSSMTANLMLARTFLGVFRTSYLPPQLNTLCMHYTKLNVVTPHFFFSTEEGAAFVGAMAKTSTPLSASVKVLKTVMHRFAVSGTGPREKSSSNDSNKLSPLELLQKESKKWYDLRREAWTIVTRCLSLGDNRPLLALPLDYIGPFPTYEDADLGSVEYNAHTTEYRRYSPVKCTCLGCLRERYSWIEHEVCHARNRSTAASFNVTLTKELKRKREAAAASRAATAAAKAAAKAAAVAAAAASSRAASSSSSSSSAAPASAPASGRSRTVTRAPSSHASPSSRATSAGAPIQSSAFRVVPPVWAILYPEHVRELHIQKQNFAIEVERLRAAAALLRDFHSEDSHILAGDAAWVVSEHHTASQGGKDKLAARHLVPENQLGILGNLTRWAPFQWSCVDYSGSSSLTGENVVDRPAWCDISWWLGCPGPIATTLYASKPEEVMATLEALRAAEAKAGPLYWNPQEQGMYTIAPAAAAKFSDLHSTSGPQSTSSSSSQGQQPLTTNGGHYSWSKGDVGKRFNFQREHTINIKRDDWVAFLPVSPLPVHLPMDASAAFSVLQSVVRGEFAPSVPGQPLVVQPETWSAEAAAAAAAASAASLSSSSSSAAASPAVNDGAKTKKGRAAAGRGGGGGGGEAASSNPITSDSSSTPPHPGARRLTNGHWWVPQQFSGFGLAPSLAEDLEEQGKTIFNDAFRNIRERLSIVAALTSPSRWPIPLKKHEELAASGMIQTLPGGKMIASVSDAVGPAATGYDGKERPVVASTAAASSSSSSANNNKSSSRRFTAPPNEWSDKAALLSRLHDPSGPPVRSGALWTVRMAHRAVALMQVLGVLPKDSFAGIDEADRRGYPGSTAAGGSSASSASAAAASSGASGMVEETSASSSPISPPPAPAAQPSSTFPLSYEERCRYSQNSQLISGIAALPFPGGYVVANDGVSIPIPITAADGVPLLGPSALARSRWAALQSPSLITLGPGQEASRIPGLLEDDFCFPLPIARGEDRSGAGDGPLTRVLTRIYDMPSPSTTQLPGVGPFELGGFNAGLLPCWAAMVHALPPPTCTFKGGIKIGAGDWTVLDRVRASSLGEDVLSCLTRETWLHRQYAPPFVTYEAFSSHAAKHQQQQLSEPTNTSGLQGKVAPASSSSSSSSSAPPFPTPLSPLTSTTKSSASMDVEAGGDTGKEGPAHGRSDSVHRAATATTSSSSFAAAAGGGGGESSGSGDETVMVCMNMSSIVRRIIDTEPVAKDYALTPQDAPFIIDGRACLYPAGYVPHHCTFQPVVDAVKNLARTFPPVGYSLPEPSKTLFAKHASTFASSAHVTCNPSEITTTSALASHHIHLKWIEGAERKAVSFARATETGPALAGDANKKKSSNKDSIHKTKAGIAANSTAMDEESGEEQDIPAFSSMGDAPAAAGAGAGAGVPSTTASAQQSSRSGSDNKPSLPSKKKSILDPRLLSRNSRGFFVPTEGPLKGKPVPLGWEAHTDCTTFVPGAVPPVRPPHPPPHVVSNVGETDEDFNSRKREREVAMMQYVVPITTQRSKPGTCIGIFPAPYSYEPARGSTTWNAWMQPTRDNLFAYKGILKNGGKAVPSGAGIFTFAAGEEDVEELIAILDSLSGEDIRSAWSLFAKEQVKEDKRLAQVAAKAAAAQGLPPPPASHRVATSKKAHPNVLAALGPEVIRKARIFDKLSRIKAASLLDQRQRVEAKRNAAAARRRKASASRRRSASTSGAGVASSSSSKFKNEDEGEKQQQKKGTAKSSSSASSSSAAKGRARSASADDRRATSATAKPSASASGPLLTQGRRKLMALGVTPGSVWDFDFDPDEKIAYPLRPPQATTLSIPGANVLALADAHLPSLGNVGSGGLHDLTQRLLKKKEAASKAQQEAAAFSAQLRKRFSATKPTRSARSSSRGTASSSSAATGPRSERGTSAAHNSSSSASELRATARGRSVTPVSRGQQVGAASVRVAVAAAADGVEEDEVVAAAAAAPDETGTAKSSTAPSSSSAAPAVAPPAQGVAKGATTRPSAAAPAEKGSAKGSAARSSATKGGAKKSTASGAKSGGTKGSGPAPTNPAASASGPATSAAAAPLPGSGGKPTSKLTPAQEAEIDAKVQALVKMIRSSGKPFKPESIRVEIIPLKPRKPAAPASSSSAAAAAPGTAPSSSSSSAAATTAAAGAGTPLPPPKKRPTTTTIGGFDIGPKGGVLTTFLTRPDSFKTHTLLARSLHPFTLWRLITLIVGLSERQSLTQRIANMARVAIQIAGSPSTLQEAGVIDNLERLLPLIVVSSYANGILPLVPLDEDSRPSVVRAILNTNFATATEQMKKDFFSAAPSSAAVTQGMAVEEPFASSSSSGGGGNSRDGASSLVAALSAVAAGAASSSSSSSTSQPAATASAPSPISSAAPLPPPPSASNSSSLPTKIFGIDLDANVLRVADVIVRDFGSSEDGSTFSEEKVMAAALSTGLGQKEALLTSLYACKLIRRDMRQRHNKLEADAAAAAAAKSEAAKAERASEPVRRSWKTFGYGSNTVPDGTTDPSWRLQRPSDDVYRPGSVWEVGKKLSEEEQIAEQAREAELKKRKAAERKAAVAAAATAAAAAAISAASSGSADGEQRPLISATGRPMRRASLGAVYVASPASDDGSNSSGDEGSDGDGFEASSSRHARPRGGIAAGARGRADSNAAASFHGFDFGDEDDEDDEDDECSKRASRPVSRGLVLDANTFLRRRSLPHPPSKQSKKRAASTSTSARMVAEQSAPSYSSSASVGPAAAGGGAGGARGRGRAAASSSSSSSSAAAAPATHKSSASSPAGLIRLPALPLEVQEAMFKAKWDKFYTTHPCLCGVEGCGMAIEGDVAQQRKNFELHLKLFHVLPHPLGVALADGSALCAICAMPFPSLLQAQKHEEEVHWPQRSWARCELGCGHTARDHGHMRTHQMSACEHNLQKFGYPCDEPGCTHVATQPGHLKAHKKTHLPPDQQQRRHYCQWKGCGNKDGFRKKGHLDVHVAGVHLLRRWRCPVVVDGVQCTHLATKEDNCYSHMRDVHGIPRDHPQFLELKGKIIISTLTKA